MFRRRIGERCNVLREGKERGMGLRRRGNI